MAKVDRIGGPNASKALATWKLTDYNIETREIVERLCKYCGLYDYTFNGGS